jgi:hypothetical protein
MLKANVRVENINGLDAQFEDVIRAIEHNLSEVADIIEGDAQATSSFIDRSGDLRGSIKKQKSKFEDGGYIVMASGKGTAKGYHAALVEFGHVLIAWGHPTGKRVPAKPFMRRALERGIIRAVELFK